jgi:hypothetical protein
MGHATNTQPVCKTGNSGGYVCTGDGKTYDVSNAASAAAAAAAVAAQQQAQQQQQSQSQTSTNTNTNVATGGAGGQGGKAVIKMGDTFIAPAPQASSTGWCFTMVTGGVCVPMKSVQIALRLDLIDRCQAKVGQGKFYDACMHAIAQSTQVRRALVDAGLMIKKY